MSETSSDDFSDIEYTKNKNEHISDADSFEDFSPSPSKKRKSNDDEFGSDQFEPDDDENDIDDDDEDEDDLSSKPEMSNIGGISSRNASNNNSMGSNDNSNAANINHHNRVTANNSNNNNVNGNNPISHLYYNPRDYDTLNVNNEIKRLFEYIERFKYNEIELETTLKPFIPDYIPSIGNVDSFIKPTRTTTNFDKEENEEKLGLVYLDEPILNQSDPSTFHLRLINESKQISSNKHTKISYIVDAEKNPNKIRNWIDNFKKIKAKTSSTNIDGLPNNLPEIEQLMQPFINEKFNKYIKDKQNEESDIVPSYNINLPLLQYAKIICNLLDIPVHSDQTITSSLHVLFSTFAALQTTNE